MAERTAWPRDSPLPWPLPSSHFCSSCQSSGEMIGGYAWAGFMASGDYLRYIGGPQGRPLAWRGLMSVIGSWAALGYGFFSVFEKSSGRWIGRLGPWQPEGWPGTEVGWGIVESEGGKGYASEGAAAAIDWAFDRLDWSEVIHTIDTGNLASKGVAAKLGSRYLRQDRR